MGAVLHFFVNLFVIVAAIAPFLVAVTLILYRTRRLQERLIRGLALFTAALVILGMQAAGVAVGGGIVDSLEVKGFGGLIIKTLWAVLAAGGGALLGRYLTSQLQASSAVQIRIMVFVGAVAHVELLEIYISSFSRNGFAIGAGAIPDIAFIFGLVMYIVLKYDPEAVRDIRSGLPHRQNPAVRTAGDESNLRLPLIEDEEYIDLFGENP